MIIKTRNIWLIVKYFVVVSALISGGIIGKSYISVSLGLFYIYSVAVITLWDLSEEELERLEIIKAAVLILILAVSVMVFFKAVGLGLKLWAGLSAFIPGRTSVYLGLAAIAVREIGRLSYLETKSKYFIFNLTAITFCAVACFIPRFAFLELVGAYAILLFLLVLVFKRTFAIVQNFIGKL